MKEIIVITSYTPDKKKRDTLRNLVISLKKGGYDILVISHSPIPTDIQENVEFVIYDKKNEILTEAKYLPQPWFRADGWWIQSAFVANSTQLTVWRMLCLAFPMVKSLGYGIIHLLEYDSYIENFSEFKENKKLIEEGCDSVFYINENSYNGKWDYEVIVGSFQSLKVSSIPDIFMEFNKEKILQIIEKNPTKSAEKMFEDIISDGKKIIKKNVSLLNNGNILRISEKLQDDKHPWAVPYYDRLSDEMHFFYLNQKDYAVQVFITTNKKTYLLKVEPGVWHITGLGNFRDIEFVICMIEGKMRNFFDFSTYDRETFKELSWRSYE
jgi:hypothetical protein